MIVNNYCKILWEFNVFRRTLEVINSNNWMIGSVNKSGLDVQL